MSAEQTPQPLKTWIPWVLHGYDSLRCTYLQDSDATQPSVPTGNAMERVCAWPGVLNVRIAHNDLTFDQSWRLDHADWVPLPGTITSWPQDVIVDGNPGSVIDHGGRPTLYVPAGEHIISGHIQWLKRPESVAVPGATGIISLSVDNMIVPSPRLDIDGNLWLSALTTAGAVADNQEQFDLQVFRKITDDVPMQIVTRLHARVAGRQREVRLRSVLVAGSRPLKIDSALPLRLESDGHIHLLVRPGDWTIEVTARMPSDTTTLQLPSREPGWPETETWSFEARNDLRIVTVTGGTAVDPTQNLVPPEWQQFPAYRIQPEDTFSLHVERRGDSEPVPDRLQVQRSLWLDFDGKGYTVNDSVTGILSKSWRLDAGPELRLGRVAVDGLPRLVTHLQDAAISGIEVRQGTVNINADSRMDLRGPLPVAGWRNDFQSVTATLHLPPGWRLLAAPGVDNAPGTWLQRWTLLDLFLVLMTALAARKLWGNLAGITGLLTLMLCWHSPGAPTIHWLLLLAAIALIRALPEGRLRSGLQACFYVGIFSLLITAIPFLVSQARTAIYPQLEEPSSFGDSHYSLNSAALDLALTKEPALGSGMAGTEEATPADDRIIPSDAMPLPAKPVPRSKALLRNGPAQQSTISKAVSDPDAKVQTGPGLPAWRWHTQMLNWQGPVEQSRTFNLYLLSPTVNSILSILRIVLILAFAGYCIDRPRRSGSGGRFRFSGAATVSSCTLLLFFSMLAGPADAEETADAGGPGDPAIADAVVDAPDAAVLTQLRERLLAPPDCYPHCADIARAHIELREDTITMRLEIHALSGVSVPLPGHAEQWIPTAVLDGKNTLAVLRRSDGSLWTRLDVGRHDVLLHGSLRGRHSVRIPLPLRPHTVQFKTAGWSVDGVREDGSVESQLQLTRVAVVERHDGGPIDEAVLPGFARVDRTLHLGLEWRVATQIQKLSPSATTIAFEVPLLPGESVLTPNIRTVGAKASIALQPGTDSLRWESALTIAPALDLSATSTTDFVEVWHLDVEPVWHVESSGLDPSQNLDSSSRAATQWHPWPGEKLHLDITRPVGVTGPTLTVDQSVMSVKPGQNVTDVDLQLRLRSSQGGGHKIRLPAGSTLLSITTDNKPQALRPQEGVVTVPLIPGTQDVHLQWREQRGVSTMFATSPVDIGIANVNHTVKISPGPDRWILGVRGPNLGPAILFWGTLAIATILALVLAKATWTPLRFRHWWLLSLGMTQAGIVDALLVVGWLLALGARGRLSRPPSPRRFNTMQVFLAVLTLIALALLFSNVEHGLLGSPEMRIAGNGSTASELIWFQDRCAATPPFAWLLSLPLWTYRLVMLAWALWLASALLGWLRWGWHCFVTHGVWLKSAVASELSTSPQITPRHSDIAGPPEIS